jgi:hypothetical protein
VTHRQAVAAYVLVAVAFAVDLVVAVLRARLRTDAERYNRAAKS